MRNRIIALSAALLAFQPGIYTQDVNSKSNLDTPKHEQTKDNSGSESRKQVDADDSKALEKLKLDIPKYKQVDTSAESRKQVDADDSKALEKLKLDIPKYKQVDTSAESKKQVDADDSKALEKLKLDTHDAEILKTNSEKSESIEQ